MKKHPEEYLSGNLTAMIDVVFQLIIFFVCTVSLQDQVMDDRVRLAMAPHGKPVETKNPLEINISVDSTGRAFITGTFLPQGNLVAILHKAVQDNGSAQVPVVIRGDGSTKHEAIKQVMNACAQAGIWKIKFAALRESGKGG